MAEKTEWEIVDTDAFHKPPPAQEMMATLLGPWWKWKLAGITAVMGLILLFVVTIAGVFILGMAMVALSFVCIGKVRKWLEKRSLPGRSGQDMGRMQ